MSPVFEKCTALVVVTEKSGRAARLIIIRRTILVAWHVS